MKKIFVLFLLFLSSQAFAIVVDTSNSICGNYAYDKMYALFEPFSYTCNAGYYLPANALACEQCTNGFNCSGGTYIFNENISQGLTRNTNNYNAELTTVCATNVDKVYNAVFEPIQYNCSAGYYLPANGIECTICPANSACVGGTYSFNETTDQGIVACDGSYSPSGSTVCYQHILHIGNDNIYLRSTKLTTPSLNIQIGNDIFYANMTTTPTYMNKDSSHYLHILYEGVDYYVCDDTTYQE